MEDPPRSKVKGIRIPAWVSDALAKEATETNSSVNSVIVSALIRHAEWERPANKFGFVTIPGRLLRSLIEAMEESQVTRIAAEHARLAREEAVFWFSENTPETHLKFLRLFYKYSGIYEFEETRDLDSPKFVLKHDLGLNWSRFESAISTTSWPGASIQHDVHYFPELVEIKFRTSDTSKGA